MFCMHDIEHALPELTWPIVFVSKKYGSIRSCTDYRKLKPVTARVAYLVSPANKYLEPLGIV